jgi:hypothetical protein
MVLDLLSYKGSFLNPLLKVLVLVLFAVAVYYFYRCRCRYGGKLQVVAALLLLGGIAGILASLFRIGGDLSVQWKWAESTFFLVLAIITLAIAILVRRKFKNAIVLFGAEQGGEQE